MASKDKLIGRLKSQPNDFRWEELVSLLKYLGYEKYEGRGSRVCFRREGSPQIRLHKPHPSKIIKKYAVKDVLGILSEAKLI